MRALRAVKCPVALRTEADVTDLDAEGVLAADGRRETIERRALDAADGLVAVRASVLRVGKKNRF